MSFSRPVRGPDTNHLCSALSQAQLFGHGNLEVLVQVEGKEYRATQVIVEDDPILDRRIVSIKTEAV